MTTEIKNENKNEKLMPIFQINPQSDSRIKCKYVGVCEDLGKLTDDVIDTTVFFDKLIDNETGNLGKINGYSLFGKYCTPNISGSYLISNKKLPVFYFSVLYTKTFVGGCLCNISIYFTIDDESAKKLDNPKKYVGSHINGKFTTEISFPEENNIIEKLQPIIENDIMVKNADTFDENNENNEILFLKIKNDVDKIVNRLNEYIKSSDITFCPTKRQAFLKIIRPFYSSHVFNELMTYCLSLREIQRKEEKCPDLSFEAPTNYIDLAEIKKDPSKLDNYFNSKKKQ
jgi:hypothetical protein